MHEQALNDTVAATRDADAARRTFLLGAAAVALLPRLLSAAHAQTAAADPATIDPTRVSWEEAMRALIGDAKPTEGRIALDLPNVAENGNVVPFTVTVESPMTDADYVKVVHVFATQNPRPDIASFYFTPQNAKAQAASRMRLVSTQDIVVVAEMADGKHFMTKKNVKVTIGGCGG